MQFIYCFKKTTPFPAQIFMKITNSAGSAVHILLPLSLKSHNTRGED
jgi:hypothetical protein